MSKYYYIDLSLEFPIKHNPVITPAFLKHNILKAVKQLFGEVGAATRIDIVKCDGRRAILRVPRNFYVKLRSSLTLHGDYQGNPCAYRVTKSAPILLNLLADSRSYEH